MARAAQVPHQFEKPSWTGSFAQKGARPRRRMLEERLASLKRENDDLNRAVYEAAQAQRRLCGPRHFRSGCYEFASEIFPVRHLSGDFVSVMQVEGDIVFAIGDIAGKGLLAGMWFTHMVGMIRREILAHRSPAAALSAIDHHLEVTGLEFPLTTLFLARLNPATGQLTYCNAGHPAALLVRENGELEELGEGGPVLGAISGAPFVNGQAVLYPHNTLIAFSDGITECRNDSGIEFGSERLWRTVEASSRLDADAILFSVLAAAESFSGNRRREDDVALLVLRRLGSCEIQ
jgi:serine phosphatase RsbU (regulator of sigma subunit)